MTTEVERLPPQDLDAERSLLGSVLIDPDAYHLAADIVSAGDFYRDQHRVIWLAMQALVHRNIRPDTVTVSDELRKGGNLKLAGGPAYLSDLVNAVLTAFHVEHYAEISERTGTLRRVIHAAGQMVALAYRPDAETATVIEEAERLLFQIAGRASRSEPQMLVEAIRPVSDSLMEDGQAGGLRGIASGLASLDKLTGGFQRSDLIIVAARPGMGKTAFALQVALHAAAQNQIPVGFFSLEMSSEQLVHRLLAHQAQGRQHAYPRPNAHGRPARSRGEGPSVAWRAPDPRRRHAGNEHRAAAQQGAPAVHGARGGPTRCGLPAAAERGQPP